MGPAAVRVHAFFYAAHAPRVWALCKLVVTTHSTNPCGELGGDRPYGEDFGLPKFMARVSAIGDHLPAVSLFLACGMSE
jgi:hypothetical protein